METTSITLALSIVAIAITVTAWMVISRHGKSRERGPERKDRQEPRQPDSTTADESSVLPAEPHAPVAEDEPKATEDETSTVAATEQTPTHEGDAGLAIKEDLIAQVQEGISDASVESPESSIEAKPPDTKTHLKSEPQQSALVQQLQGATEQPGTDGEVRLALVEGAEEVCEPTEPDVAEPVEKAVRKPRKNAPASPPEQRGGRSRVSMPSGDFEREQKPKPRAPKPEIVCWKREREWILAVELPDERFEKPGVTVVQADKPLAEDKPEKGCWRLVQLQGEITVRAVEAETENLSKIALGDDDYLLFKLSGGDQGRHVKRVSYGSYLVIVPAAWERNEDEAGPAPAMPEPVCLDDYQAHFFDLVGNGAVRIVFRDDTGHSVVIDSGVARFQIVGDELHDASENLGPLFVGAPPRICDTDGVWENVGTVVLGEEGRGTGKWRKAFNIDSCLPEQELPVEILQRKAGWYFVRFYDLQGDLIESLDFRFAAGLRQITTHQGQPFPSATGHELVTVEFEHDADWSVAALLGTSQDVEIEHSAEKTILKIPPVPECDLSRWTLGPRGGPQVEVALLVERVWSAVSNIDKPPLQWRDTCLCLLVEDFATTSEKAVWLRLPKPRWADSVLLGFQSENRREYALKVAERTLAIPLRDFCDAPALTECTKDCTLKIWVNGNEAVVAAVSAETTEEILDIARIRAHHLAKTLTRLRAVTSGPLRQLLKEVRRKYHRPACSTGGRNVEFMKEAFCVIAMIQQLADSQPFLAPKTARRLRSKAQLAGKEFPDTMRQVWRRYRELEGRTTRN